jgi:DNA-binding CsgD family transcriptional regulator
MVYATHRIIRDCNRDFAALFAAPRENIVGRSFARLYPEIGDFIRRGEQWAANFAGEGAYYDERVMARLNGERFWCRVHGRSLAAADPFAEAIYCFEPLNRAVVQSGRTLSERQREILAQVAQGKTNAEIAEEIGLSRRTVEAHRARLMKAVGVRNGAALMEWFLQREGTDNLRRQQAGRR